MIIDYMVVHPFLSTDFISHDIIGPYPVSPYTVRLMALLQWPIPHGYVQHRSSFKKKSSNKDYLQVYNGNLKYYLL